MERNSVELSLSSTILLGVNIPAKYTVLRRHDANAVRYDHFVGITLCLPSSFYSRCRLYPEGLAELLYRSIPYVLDRRILRVLRTFFTPAFWVVRGHGVLPSSTLVLPSIFNVNRVEHSRKNSGGSSGLPQANPAAYSIYRQ